jgi:hypothetical protein
MLDFLYWLFVGAAALMFAQLVYPCATIFLAQVLGKERINPTPDGRGAVLRAPLRCAPLPSGEGPGVGFHDFACVITAYRNVAIAQPLVESLLRQTHAQHMIYLVADECPAFDFGIEDPRFVPLRPDPPLRLKAKSIIHALENFRRPHDFVAVFDADNLAHPHFLEEVNRYANAGFRCIQGQRRAKNLDSTYAALDSMGEHYKNYIERRVPYLLGGSAVISGSGMATEAGLYKAYLESPEIEQGKQQWKKMLQEDKILQNFLLRRAERIAYAHRAIVYDEKVETGAAVETQRSRWLFSYFQNVPNALGIFRRGFFSLNINQLYFGWVTLALPMFIQLAVAGWLVVLGFFLAPGWSLALLGAMGVFGLGVLWALRLDGAPPEVWRALWQVPRFVARQLAGLLKMGNPNKNFKHTEHRKVVRVEDLTKRDDTER